MTLHDDYLYYCYDVTDGRADDEENQLLVRRDVRSMVLPALQPTNNTKKGQKCDERDYFYGFF